MIIFRIILIFLYKIKQNYFLKSLATFCIYKRFDRITYKRIRMAQLKFTYKVKIKQNYKRFNSITYKRISKDQAKLSPFFISTK